MSTPTASSGPSVVPSLPPLNTSLPSPSHQQQAPIGSPTAATSSVFVPDLPPYEPPQLLISGPIQKAYKVPSQQRVVSSKWAIVEKFVRVSELAKQKTSYAKNTQKEETLLEYVEDFRRQFIQVFPNRRPLLLCPKNECGIRKFVCSTIHPTCLPFQDCYDYLELSEFVSDFLTYIPLDNPTTLPDLLPSTHTMIQCRYGDCLDMSVFLVSLLRGAGYNAYVVCGYAPKWITQADLSDVEFPSLFKDDGLDKALGKHKLPKNLKKKYDKLAAIKRAQTAVNGFRRAKTAAATANANGEEKTNNAADGASEGGNAAGTSEDGTSGNALSTTASAGNEEDDGDIQRRAVTKYEILTKPDHKSAFLAARDAERLEKERKVIRDEEERIQREKERIVDSLHGQRAHAWVLVKGGRRDISEEGAFFIEASTGMIYPIKEAPYLQIDAVFNEKNYWVNVQTVPHTNHALNIHNSKPAIPSSLPSASLYLNSANNNANNPSILHPPPGSFITINKMNFDLANQSCWEYVLIDESRVLGGANKSRGKSRATTAAAASNSNDSNDGSSGGNSNGGSNNDSTGSNASGNSANSSTTNNEDSSSVSASSSGTSGGGGGDFDSVNQHRDGDGEGGSRVLAPEEVGDWRDVLDAPQSWTLPILISRNEYERRFAAGSRFILFNSCTVEKFSPYIRPLNGLVKKICIYHPPSNAAYLNGPLEKSPLAPYLYSRNYQEQVSMQLALLSRQPLLEIRETFKYRSDNLLYRITHPIQRKITSYYGPGKNSGLKQYTVYYGPVKMKEIKEEELNIDEDENEDDDDDDDDDDDSTVDNGKGFRLGTSYAAKKAGAGADKSSSGTGSGTSSTANALKKKKKKKINYYGRKHPLDIEDEDANANASEFSSGTHSNELDDEEEDGLFGLTTGEGQITCRIFRFYAHARVDGLIKRIEKLGHKVMEFYRHRDDRLIYRSIAVDRDPHAMKRPKVFTIPLSNGHAGGGLPGSNTSEYPVCKLTEKYARNTDVMPGDPTTHPSTQTLAQLNSDLQPFPLTAAENDIRKRTHFLINDTIRLDYHFTSHHITASRHVIDKKDKLDLAETEGPKPNSEGFLLRIDPTWKERSRGEEQQFVAKLLSVEKELKVKVKEREIHMAELVRSLDMPDAVLRSHASNNIATLAANAAATSSSQHVDFEEFPEDMEELRKIREGKAQKIDLIKSFYDVAYEDSLSYMKQQEQQVILAQQAAAAAAASSMGLDDDDDAQERNALALQQQQQAQSAMNSKVDYLTPFLQAYPQNRPLNKRQCQAIKEEVLATLKERLLERAHIIQSHLDEEQNKYHQRQALFKRQAGAVGSSNANNNNNNNNSMESASEEFHKFSQACLFRIDILLARRARHEELALKKYVEMDERLNNDPRLAALHSAD